LGNEREFWRRFGFISGRKLLEFGGGGEPGGKLGDPEASEREAIDFSIV
jgi:hypothetical protein